MPWILIVDCNDFDVSVVLRVLAKEGLTEAVKLCANGKDAIDLLSKSTESPSLVLMENRLPGMSGLELLRWIRSQAQFKLVPVVFFSGDDRPSAIAQALEGGANSYMSKPTDYDQMFADLRAAAHYWLRVHAGRPTDLLVERI